MPQILVRDLDEALVERLKRQAKRHLLWIDDVP